MKNHRITGLFAILLAGLTACGPMQDGNRAAATVQGLFAGLTSGGEEAPAVAGAPVSRAMIEAQGADLLRVSIFSRDAVALLIKGGTNGTRVTWLSPEGISLVFDNGLLIGSRGFGDDLMGADVAAAKSSLNGGGTHLRTLDFLTGLDRIERTTFQCATVQTKTEVITIFEISYTTNVLEETCRSDAVNFKNTYWRDSRGIVWQSRQWISPQVGYLGYQRL